MEDVGQDTCFGAGSVAGAVIGTFLTTILLLAVAALLYRQWRRHKGKHLVLVTDPEIVEDAYAFDNPCFKDATPGVGGRAVERPLSTPADTPAKDTTRWSTPWTSLGIGSGNRNDKRRTLDDSCLGPKATRVSVVSLRSRDFTGLGFNVCGNMREGIFVKDLLHRGPASESGRIHPGDRIASVKISFRNMVYEDALTILSYASPYDVELEVESGGTGSKPATLLKKTVGPTPSRLCHPLYRSQSIPELSEAHKSAARRLFIAEPNESMNSNYSTMNSTLKSSKSTPGSQTLERRHEEVKNNHHHKFGIKVLPALDGTVHRIENQNEHNTNLERRHSKKLVAEKSVSGTCNRTNASGEINEDRKICPESLQQRESQQKVSKRRQQVPGSEMNGIDVPDKGDKKPEETINIPSEVPTEVHNAAMAARRNRKSSSDLLNAQKAPAGESAEAEGAKSPQKNKRKAPAPPKVNVGDVDVSKSALIDPKKPVSPSPRAYDSEKDDTIDSIADYTESLTDYVTKVRENTEESNREYSSDAQRQRLEAQAVNRRNSESDTDSEVQNNFTTIELNPGDITIHRTPVPEVNDDEDEDDMYRKAASLGDLSKYENKTSTPLERAQSLDMTDTGSKKRKAPLPPEDINESTEDLTKLDQMDTFDKRKLKKSSEWGTLEDVIWGKGEMDDKSKKPRTRKKSNGTLERSKSAVEIKLKEETPTSASDRLNDAGSEAECETSIELYNLPLSKRLTQEFIHAERMFNPDEDNSLARIVNNGEVVKSPTLEEIELDFRQAKPLPDESEDDAVNDESMENGRESASNEEFNRALRYFELHSSKSIDEPSNESIRANLNRLDERKDEKVLINDVLYGSKKAVVEEPMSKVTVDRGCHGCEELLGRHSEFCSKQNTDNREKYSDLSQSDKRLSGLQAAKVNLTRAEDWKDDKVLVKDTLYSDRKAVVEEPMVKISVERKCRACSSGAFDKHDDHCDKCNADSKEMGIDDDHLQKDKWISVNKFNRNSSPEESIPSRDQLGTSMHLQIGSKAQVQQSHLSNLDDGTKNKNNAMSTFQARRTKFEQNSEANDGYSPIKSKSPSDFETHFAKRVVNITNSKTFNAEEDDEEDEYEFGSSVTVNSKNMSSPKDDRHNISNISVSSGENSEDSGLVRESIDYNPRDLESRPPLPNTPIPNTSQKMTYITEIKVSPVRENLQDLESENEEIVSIMENNGEPKKSAHHEITITSNGKPMTGKKPPVPPRRSDITKAAKEDQTDKQVVYVSEYKSPAGRSSQVSNSASSESDATNKKFEHWIFLGDNKEQNVWGNGSSQSQSVTNIMLSSGDEKIMHQ